MSKSFFAAITGPLPGFHPPRVSPAIIVAATSSILVGAAAASTPAAAQCHHVEVCVHACVDTDIRHTLWRYQPPFSDIAYGDENGVYVRAGSPTSHEGHVYVVPLASGSRTTAPRHMHEPYWRW
jgi:hypothetical protein